MIDTSYLRDPEILERHTKNWVSKELKLYLKNANKIISWNDYSKKYVLLITVHCGHLRVDGKDQVQSALAQFRKVYLAICDIVIKHYQRKPWLQPLCCAFFDYEGTRHGVSYSPSAKTPHVHGTMILHPETVERFDKLGLKEFQDKLNALRLSGVSSVDLRVYDPLIKPLETWIGYSAKAYTLNYPKIPDVAAEFMATFPEGYIAA